MSFEVLKNEIKSNIFRNIYLFYGPEEYLIRYYVNNIKGKLVSGPQDLNYLVLDENSADLSKLIEFCECLPIMSDKKLVIIKRAITKGKKSGNSLASSDDVIDYFSNIPEYAHVIFIEGTSIDKRSRFYKAIDKIGMVVEFDYQSKEQLANWVIKVFKENEKIIDKDKALYLVDICNPDMNSILNECLKVISFLGDSKQISVEDIDKVCTKSLDLKVFEMIDNIAQKNVEDAIRKLSDMVSLREPLLKVLILIARHIKILLQVKLALREGMTDGMISKTLGINYINKYIKQSKNFSVQQLENALIECSKADLAIKTTQTDERLILEKLIIQIARV